MSDFRRAVDDAYASMRVLARLVVLKPPATVAQIREHEQDYPCETPVAVRRLFEEVTRDAAIVWSLPTKVRRALKLNRELQFIERGEFVASLELGPPLFDSFGEWADVYPLAHGVGIKPNGEMWIGEMWNAELKLRQDAEDFFIHWANLGFLFPDRQHLEPFTNQRTRKLNSEGRLARKWRDIMAILAEV